MHTRFYPCLLALLAWMLIAGCTDDSPTPPPSGPGEVVVMTRNMYVGAEIDLENIDPGAMLESFLATSFPARADAIADEVADAQPHLVGLQEVAKLNLQVPSDPLSPAQASFVDFLDLLLLALELRGMSYEVAGSVSNLDLELAVLFDSLGLVDLRIIDRDVVLARSDVDYALAAANNYPSSRIVTFSLDGTQLMLPVLRGFVSVNATVGDLAVRFSNTHLETRDDEAAQQAQAAELLDTLDRLAASNDVPDILVGDFNSLTPPQDPAGATYQALLAENFTDIGPAAASCCHPRDLMTSDVQLSQRIDLVLARTSGEPVTVLSTDVVGDELADRISVTLPGAGTVLLWPSDHAGVVVELMIAE